MSTTSARSLLLVALACAVAAPLSAAGAQSAAERARERAEEARERARERMRVERERQEHDREIRLRAERDRLDRSRREQSMRLAEEQRERAARLARERRDREAQLARERRARESYLRSMQQRQRRLYDDRPRVSLSGGIDLRQFDGDDDRYIVHGGVDFRGRGGLGMRPEVMYAWSDRSVGAQVVTGPTGQPIFTTGPVGRTRALGVMLNASYTFLRGSAVRPYVLGGPGVLSTRIIVPTSSVISLQPGQSTQINTRAQHELDIGLNTGAGLEFVVGPIRLFTEARYFLTDSPVPRGFSGMVPITAGVRF